MAKTPATKKNVVTLTHEEASRKNIPTAEYQSVMRTDEQSPIRIAYERRNRDLDPQLIWRGKDEQDWSDLVVPAPPLYIQEKVHPKVLIDDLKRQTEAAPGNSVPQFDLFADFNGLPSEDAKTEFYQHDAHWSNRMILGDSLQVMASLAEREGLRGKVQCIYFDPPYGIKFSSNFQWSTADRVDKNDKAEFITREPEQVKAFRDTWRDGIHSYLTYLRDRLTVARDLLTESGAIFVQIGDENVHRVRAVLDEVFGSEHFITEILAKKKGSQISGTMDPVNDFILCYGKSPKDSNALKFRSLYMVREDEDIFEDFGSVELDNGERLTIAALEQRDELPYREDFSLFRKNYPTARVFAMNPLKSGGFRKNQSKDILLQGRTFPIKDGQCWKHTVVEDDETVTPGMTRLMWADRLAPLQTDIRFIKYASTPSAKKLSNWWDNLGGAASPIYVVQTNTELVKRCVLMCTDPGDLVLDPTCGSGTTAFAAEQWGRRWITIDTSRVALALARARIMGARYSYYVMADSKEGLQIEGRLNERVPSEQATRGDIRQGFVCARIRSNTSGSIANNAEIDVIWHRFQEQLEPLRVKLNRAASQEWQDWEIPREAAKNWSQAVKDLHASWWEQRLLRQKAIDASIAAKAEFEYLYDKPYEDNKKVRVAGPFTVESLSPHRVLAVDENDEFIEEASDIDGDARDAANFVQVILDNLQTSGVQQVDKGDKIVFSSLTPWPGERVCAEARYLDGDGKEKRAAVFVGPEFGTVSRPDLVAAAREAGDAAFDVLIACAFNYDAHSSEFNKLGRIPVLKARMNADLHMATDLKNTGKGNLFVIFGEPDIKILDEKSGEIRVKVNGVDVFHPSTGEVRSDGADGIACWFVDTDYNEESFFVRQAYFLGANDPYKALKTTLKAEINEDAWSTLHSDTSRPFPKPASGRIAVKVINHLGDEVMKVFKVN
jgi:adenine-specific DNA-methyltransferase